MATAESRTAELFKTLINASEDQQALQTRRAEVDAVNQVFADATQAQSRAQGRQPTAKQLEAERVRVEDENLRIENAGAIIRSKVDKYDVSSDQEFFLRKEGSLGARLNAELQSDILKATQAAQKDGNSPSQDPRVLDAREVYRQFYENEQAFHAQQGGIPIGEQLPWEDRNTFTPEIVRELSESKGPLGSIRNIIGGGLGGALGAVGIGASAVGLEPVGSALAGAGQKVSDAIGTQDLAGKAAELEFADIIELAQLPEGDPNKISIAEAMGRAGTLAVTDIDAFTNLVEGIGSAAVGGGVLGTAGRVANAATRASGATRVANAASRVGDNIGSGVASATRASFAGSGQGVDETLNQDEAILRAGTSLVAGQFGRIGTAETALGNAASNIARRGAPGAPGGVVRGGLTTSASESAQEFVEGTGEGLAEVANTEGIPGALTEDNIRNAAIGGAVQAPLGAVGGAAAGGVAGFTQARVNQRAEAAAQEEQDVAFDESFQATEANLRARDLEEQDVAFENSQQATIDALSEQRRAEQEAARQAEQAQAVEAERGRLNQVRTEAVGDTVAFGPDVPANQVGQLRPQVADLNTEFFEDNSGQNFINFLQEAPESQELKLRALALNQAEINDGRVTDFVETVQQGLTPELTQTEFYNLLQDAASISQQADVNPIADARVQGVQREQRAQATEQVEQEVQNITEQQNQEQAAAQSEAQASAELLQQERVAGSEAQQQLAQSQVTQGKKIDTLVRKLKKTLKEPIRDVPDDANATAQELRVARDQVATLDNSFLRPVTGDNAIPLDEYFKFTDGYLSQLSVPDRRGVLKELAEREGISQEQAGEFAARGALLDSSRPGPFTERLSALRDAARAGTLQTQNTAPTATPTTEVTNTSATQSAIDAATPGASDTTVDQVIPPRLTEPDGLLTALRGDRSTLTPEQADLRKRIRSSSSARTQIQRINTLLREVGEGGRLTDAQASQLSADIASLEQRQRVVTGKK